jgi:subtilisin family serine protease
MFLLAFLYYSQLSYASNLGYKEGELIVRFAPKAGNIQATTAERNSILSGLGGGEVKNTFKLVPGLSVVKLPDGVKVEEVLERFNKAEGILYAHPDYIKRAFSIFPNDPNFSQLWGLHNTGQTGGMTDADIDAPEAWEMHTSGGDIIVAVIDTGIDYTHPDLAANMWVNPGEIPGNGIDADGDVDIDDLGLFCKDWLWQPVWVTSQWMMMSGDGAQGDSVSVVDETSAVEIAADTLMLANVQESMLARPARLRARSQKFYDITPDTTISAYQALLKDRELKIPPLLDKMCDTTAAIEEPAASDEATDIEPFTVEEMVDWLDDIWQKGELTMNEQEYLEFRSALLKSAD